ncbi:MAG: hypothetical protein WCB67_13915 [Solirubrobacteraceae bacterium]
MSDDKSPDSNPDELPGSVSNQNNEEAEPGHGGGPETRSPSSGSGGREPARGGDGKTADGGGDSQGEASEGSQSTGDPNSAG